MRNKGALARHAAGVLVAAIILLGACNNNEEVGLEITPPGERFKYVVDHSAAVSTTTFRQDSLTAERRTSVLLGYMNDPVFGLSTASFMTQLRLSTNDVNFGDDIVLDSVRLLIKYKSAYGDTTSLQKIRIYELQESIFYDSTYYSNLDTDFYIKDGNPVAEFEFYPTPGADSLLIPIHEDIAYKILRADTVHLADNPAFLNYFKGLYLTAEPTDGTGSITYFDLSGGKSRMILYYQNSAADSLSYELVVNNNCTWVNLFDHDYAGSPIQELVNDSAGNYERFYLQAMSGLRGHLRIQFGDSLLQAAEKGVSVNKAELVIPVDPDVEISNFTRPVALRLFGANDDGTNAFIDDIFLGDDYYGGYYNVTRKAYVFNIARHVQNLLHPLQDSRVDNKGLFLTINDDRISAGRVILQNGPGNQGVQLAITYTIIR